MKTYKKKNIFLFAVLLTNCVHSAPYESNLSRPECNVRLNSLQCSLTPSVLGEAPTGDFREAIIREYGLQKVKLEVLNREDPYKIIQDFFSFSSLDSKLYSNIHTFEYLKLRESHLQTGWSYPSFPMYLGGFSNRFNDPEFTKLKTWAQKYEHYQENSATDLIREKELNSLSPLEKYEYLIGLKDYSLSQGEWAKGKKILAKHSYIPTWFGACHGTAPSSLSLKRPRRSIEVLSYNGQDLIKFYPSDIKALLSMSWARNGGKSAIIGNRCYIADPSAQSFESLPSSCVDPGAANFHLAITNSLGVLKSPLIIDENRGEEVWNRPVVSYSYKYFNPRHSSSYSEKIESSIIELDSYTNDPYKKYRNPNSSQLLGIWMTIKYIADVVPSNQDQDDSSSDRFVSLEYLYDLELNDKGKITGGMWHSKFSPDFIWYASDNALPKTTEDYLLDNSWFNFEEYSILPQKVKELAIRAASKGKISYRVIEMLHQLSRSLD